MESQPQNPEFRNNPENSPMPVLLRFSVMQGKCLYKEIIVIYHECER